jgi:MFS family permease
MWLAEFPLRRGQAWAWWAFVVSGVFGFGSFLAYLGYGYLDTWHGVATLMILPCFLVGLFRSRPSLESPRGIRALLKPGAVVSWRSPFAVGRALLLAVAGGMIVGGLTVMTFGMTRVFVPQDLTFMGVARSDLQAISARLIPLIAHDRAGFGGAICTTGVTVLICVWCAKPSRNLWQILCFAGVVGFVAAIGVHPIVGYNDLFHLAPAIVGAIMFVLGLLLCWKPMRAGSASKALP